jgi:tetratricopeptide (TPR) repeat protein
LIDPLSRAHAAATAERWEEAMQHVEAARAVSERTPFDDFQIDEIAGFVQTRQREYGPAAEAFERALDSGYLPPERMDERLRLLMQLSYEIKRYEKAVQFGNRVLEGVEQPEPDLRSMLGRAYYLAGDHRNAVTAMEAAIEDARAAGKPVEETWVQVQLSSHVELNDSAGILRSLERLAVRFPKKRYWDDLFRLMKRQPDADQRATLNLYRLMFDTDMLQGVDDYVETGRIAMRMGFPGEAVSVLEQGRNRELFAGELEEERGRQMLQEAQTAARADRRALAALETEAKAAKNGEADVQLGIAYISYGQYEQGVEAIERGREKGGLRHPSEADLMLGRALFKLGRKEDAAAAFERVGAGQASGDELRQQLGLLADLWLVYLRQPSAVSS